MRTLEFHRRSAREGYALESIVRPEFEIEPFRGFGPSAFWPFRRRSQTLTVTDDLADVRRNMRSECPRRPGVYGMLDRRGQLIYVGMSTMLPKRLVTYFQSGADERKEYRIASHTDRLVWEVIGHGLAAQVRELELIRRHRPRFNVKGLRSGRAIGHIFISRDEAPRVRVAKQVPRGVRYSWGPLALNWQIREAIEAVNRHFKLRDCRADTAMHFAEQQNLFALELRAGCVRGETGSCLGPCAGQCTRTQYSAQLRAARAFLEGRDLSPLARLEEELKDAVDASAIRACGNAARQVGSIAASIGSAGDASRASVAGAVRLSGCGGSPNAVVCDRGNSRGRGTDGARRMATPQLVAWCGCRVSTSLVRSSN